VKEEVRSNGWKAVKRTNERNLNVSQNNTLCSGFSSKIEVNLRMNKKEEERVRKECIRTQGFPRGKRLVAGEAQSKGRQR
jgi:hypothetical protein